MNLKNRIILEDYRKQKDSFVKLGEIVHGILCDVLEKADIQLFGIEHRVKSEKSLAGKLEHRDDWYNSLDDLTDILGERIICFFSDEIDKIGKLIEENFVIDWDNFSDKRALLQADSFGYLSLHYICSLPAESGYPDEICGKKFEIQIRTVLQHTWAVINHDLGYKSEFGMPRTVARKFSRIAGLFEIADDEFVRVRDTMKSYTEETRRKITENNADDVHIDMISLNEYVNRNKKMREFLKELSAVSNAEISEIDAGSYIVQLKFLGKETIGDLQRMMEKNKKIALSLAEKAFENSELDIISSSVGLRFLCRAELLNENYSLEKATEFLMLSMGEKGTKERAERQAKRLFDIYEGIKEESL